MRIAVAGKGGAGKTTFCATAARLLARAGHRVVAIDGDTNPNLLQALGGSPPASPPNLPASLVSRRLDGPPALTTPIDDVLATHGVPAPDGVTVLRMGAPEHPDEGCMCSAHATVSAVLAVLGDEPDTFVMLDLEASPEHLSRGTARHADVLLLVAEPYFRSLEAVRLQAQLAAASSIGAVRVIANKCRSDSDVEAIREFCQRHDLELLGIVPWSDAALDADATSAALLDHAPLDPAVDAIRTAIVALVPAGAATDAGGDR